MNLCFVQNREYMLENSVQDENDLGCPVPLYIVETSDSHRNGE